MRSTAYWLTLSLFSSLLCLAEDALGMSPFEKSSEYNKNVPPPDHPSIQRPMLFTSPKGHGVHKSAGNSKPYWGEHLDVHEKCSRLNLRWLFQHRMIEKSKQQVRGVKYLSSLRHLEKGSPTEVSISLFINRVSAVDESKEEISLDVFLYVYWKDHRIIMMENEVGHVELTWEQRQELWIPDLYIRQLREMKVLSLFQEMTSLRLYRNQTMRISFGATVIIKCDMDFVLYPLDVQKCAVDFSSYKYTMADMTFTWRGDPPLSFPSDFGDGYRLPKYVVSFTTEKDMQTIYYGEGNHSTARMFITMSRELRSYLLESYLPSSLFVIMSWGSFVVIPDMVPGRMVLLVTTLLSLVTMFDTVRNNSPNALELKCIEVWLISCTLFVFFALIEYFVVLFGIRYDKHWRHKKRDLDRIANAGTNAPANNDNNTAANNVAANNHHRPITHMSQLPPLIYHRGGSRIDNLRLFGGSKVAPQDGAAQEPSKDAPRSTTVRESHGVPGERGNLPARRKFRMVAEYVVLYCGSQRGMVDQVSLVLFPVCFILFAIVYWVSYVSESRSRMNI